MTHTEKSIGSLEELSFLSERVTWGRICCHSVNKLVVAYTAN
jgi:hypothetical protein